MRPRRRVLALAFVLMALSRVAGLFLPVSTRYFIDDVIGRGRVEWLLPLVLGVRRRDGRSRGCPATRSCSWSRSRRSS